MSITIEILRVEEDGYAVGLRVRVIGADGGVVEADWSGPGLEALYPRWHLMDLASWSRCQEIACWTLGHRVFGALVARFGQPTFASEHGTWTPADQDLSFYHPGLSCL